MNKQAIEKKLIKVKGMLIADGHYEGCPNQTDDDTCPVCMIDQVLALLKAEQPNLNCEGCEFFKHPNKDEHCYRYEQEKILCKLRQEFVEQPPASELTETLRDWAERMDRNPGHYGGLIVEVRKTAKLLNVACDRLDASEASRKELADALEAVKRYHEAAKEGRVSNEEGGDYWAVVMDDVEAALTKEKETNIQTKEKESGQKED